MFPAYEEVELPLLKLIYESGGDRYEMRAHNTYRPLAQHFGLTLEEQTVTRNDQLGDGRDEPVWNNRVQWARRKLNEYGYLAADQRGHWRLSEKGIEKAQSLIGGVISHFSYPDEVPGGIVEGARKSVYVNSFERSAEARQRCIDHYGYACFVCKFDFLKEYGERGRHFIHVHHIVPISQIGEEYVVDPIQDLRPVCPNCHAIIHRTSPPCSIEDLIEIRRRREL